MPKLIDINDTQVSSLRASVLLVAQTIREDARRAMAEGRIGDALLFVEALMGAMDLIDCLKEAKDVPGDEDKAPEADDQAANV